MAKRRANRTRPTPRDTSLLAWIELSHPRALDILRDSYERVRISTTRRTASRGGSGGASPGKSRTTDTRVIARVRPAATGHALTVGLCLGLAIMPAYADSMAPSAASIVDICLSDDQDDPETRGDRLTIFGPWTLGAIINLLKPS